VRERMKRKFYFSLNLINYKLREREGISDVIAMEEKLTGPKPICGYEWSKISIRLKSSQGRSSFQKYILE
jgi:hypothetical protein